MTIFNSYVNLPEGILFVSTCRVTVIFPMENCIFAGYYCRIRGVLQGALLRTHKKMWKTHGEDLNVAWDLTDLTWFNKQKLEYDGYITGYFMGQRTMIYENGVYPHLTAMKYGENDDLLSILGVTIFRQPHIMYVYNIIHNVFTCVIL